MITHLPASQRAAVPWKNGGGVTREIAVFPEGAGMDDFLWRVSMAEVTEAGPFSRFEEIDRHLTVLEGQLRLALPDRQYTLFPLEGLAFEGDTPITGTPLTERVLDLNVMTRQVHFTAQVEQVSAPARRVIATTTLVVALQPAKIDAFDLETYDAVYIDGEGTLDVETGNVIIVQLTGKK